MDCSVVRPEGSAVEKINRQVLVLTLRKKMVIFVAVTVYRGRRGHCRPHLHLAGSSLDPNSAEDIEDVINKDNAKVFEDCLVDDIKRDKQRGFRNYAKSTWVGRYKMGITINDPKFFYDHYVSDDQGDRS